MPDLVVLPRECEGTDHDHVPAAVAQLVVEVTSKATARHDRVTKAAGYAQAGVPLYLLIDGIAEEGPTVTLYGEPRDDVYHPLGTCSFGDLIELPEPIGLVLDTSGFPVPMS